MAGDQRGQFGSRYPVQPADRVAAARRGHRRGPVLAAADHSDLDGRPGDPAQRGTDDRPPLQGRVQAVEHNPQRLAGVLLAASRPGRQMPCRWCAYRHYHRPGLVPFGQPGQVLLGVHDHNVGCAQGAGVDHPQQGLAGDPAESPVPRGVAGTGEVIERNRYLAEDELSEVDVEVTEVADQHHIRYGHPAGGTGQRRPAPGEADCQGRRSPRVRQHVHSGRRVQVQRCVAFGHVYPVSLQALGDRGDSRMQRRVIGAKQQCAHDFFTLVFRSCQ